MAIAAKDFKTQNQKFKTGDTVPDDVAKEWEKFVQSKMRDEIERERKPQKYTGTYIAEH